MADPAVRSRTDAKNDEVPSFLFKEFSRAAETSADLHLD
jgi:hypothetical protein